MKTREAAVAGMFYPVEPTQLQRAVNRLLDDAPPPSGPVPKALIVPHAGYVYSGPVAASAYRRLDRARTQTQRVVLLGPAHRVPLAGMAIPRADAGTRGASSVDRMARVKGCARACRNDRSDSLARDGTIRGAELGARKESDDPATVRFRR